MDRIKIDWFTDVRKVLFFISIAIFGLLSCSDNFSLEDVNCDECYTDKPEVGPVTIYITPPHQGDKVPIKIFKGKYKESYRLDYSSAFRVDTLTDEKTIYDLPVDEYYSVEAEYTVDGKKILVVDGAKLRIQKITDSCDETCWIFKGGNIHVSLKN